MIKRLLLLFFRGGELKVCIIPGSSSLLPAPFPSRRRSQFGSRKALTQAAPQAREWFFGALQGHFSLLIKKNPQKTKQQNKRATEVPCTRDVPLQNSTETTGPSSQAGSPGSSFLGRTGDKEHLAAVEVGKAPQAPAPGLEKHLRAPRPSGRRSRS